MGVTMSPARRTELVAWATEKERWIIEDDYDSEFRYDRRPIGAVQSLAPDRVIHGGTASKSLAAGLRIGWLTVPAALRGPLLRTMHIRAGVSTIDQLTLADFIDSRSLDRHITSMRQRYRRRRDVVVDRVGAEVPWLALPEVVSGLHFSAPILDPAIDETKLLRAAEQRSVGLVGLSSMYAKSDQLKQSGLVIGFSRPPEHHFAAAVDELLELLTSAGSW
jgi:GntR family transcriptional regulator/MocR family aminotransferase